MDFFVVVLVDLKYSSGAVTHISLFDLKKAAVRQALYVFHKFINDNRLTNLLQDDDDFISMKIRGNTTYILPDVCSITLYPTNLERWGTNTILEGV